MEIFYRAVLIFQGGDLEIFIYKEDTTTHTELSGISATHTHTPLPTAQRTEDGETATKEASARPDANGPHTFPGRSQPGGKGSRLGPTHALLTPRFGLLP